MSKKATLLLLTVILSTVIYLSFKLGTDEENNILGFSEEGIGTISNHGAKTIDVSYDYQSRRYTYTRGIPFSNLVEGEQYPISIYKKDPSRILVHMDRPILDTINYKWKTTGVIKIAQLPINRSQLKFSYYVNGIAFTRIQTFSDSAKGVNQKHFIVKYRLDKPEIGYLTYK